VSAIFGFGESRGGREARERRSSRREEAAMGEAGGGGTARKETEERDDADGTQRSRSVPRNMADGANPHIVRIFPLG